jgi:hypothetical protein
LNRPLFEKLHREGLIGDDALQKVTEATRNPLFSVHGELKTLLFLGVFLLSGGLGIWIYKHLDSIDHMVIVAAIAAVCGGCFGYNIRFKRPFSPKKVESPGVLYDYILLLGCLTLLTLIAYLQYEYAFFGKSPRLAGFIPLLVLFPAAYYWDHLGVLSLAITTLAAWLGLVVTPLGLWTGNDFNDVALVYTALGLGFGLTIAAALSKRSGFKAHFAFTYANFGMHLLFISSLAGMFYYYHSYLFLWLVLLLALVAWFYRQATRERSFYFLLALSLYGYVGISAAVVRLLLLADDSIVLYMLLIYFILSGLGIGRFLVRENNKMSRQ